MEKYGKRDFSMTLTRIMKVLLVVAVIFCMALPALPVEAREISEYSVTKDGAFFKLSEYAEGEERELYSSETLSELFECDALKSGAEVILRGIAVTESVTLKNKSLILRGSVEFSGAELIIDGGNVTLSSFSAEFSGDCGIRLKNGELNIESSSVRSHKSPAVRLDYSSSATLVTRESELYSESFM